MRFCHRLHYWLPLALVTVCPALNTNAFTLYITNGSPSTVGATAYRSWSGTNETYWFDATTAGYSHAGVWPATINGYPAYKVVRTSDSHVWGPYFDTNTAWVDIGQASLTYYYCVYHVVWNNTGPSYAQFHYYIDAPGGPEFPVDWQARIISPGNGVDFYVTNNIGTSPGTCYDLVAGDARAGSTVPDAVITGTRYGVENTAYPDGAGDGRVTPGDDPNHKYPPGSETNAPTTGDIRLIVTGLEYLDKDLNEGFAMVGDYLGDIKDGVLNLSLLSSNEVAATTAGSSNIVAEVNKTRTNIVSKMDDLIGLMTNLVEVLTNDALGTNWGWNGQTNLNTNINSYAQGAWDGTSNALGGFGLSGSSNVLWGPALATEQEAFGDLAATEPPAGFGMLDLGEGWKMRYLDLKLMLSGIALDFDLTNPDAGFNLNSGTIGAAIRLLLLWGLLAAAIVEYASLLKETIMAGLNIPAWGSTTNVAGVDTALRIGYALLFLSALMFLPSILLAIASTGFTILGMQGGTAQAIGYVTGGMVGGVAAGTGNGFIYTLALLNEWLPLVETAVLALNWVVAWFSMSGAILMLGSWRKVVS